MTTFILVHGSWLGGWVWDGVRERLEARGHRVFAPTLSGVADRSHLHAEEIGLLAHAKDIAGLILWHDLQDVVLVGHSYGGMVITAALRDVHERVAALVYVDAFVPDEDQSALDILPELADAFTAPEDHSWAIAPLPPQAFALSEPDDIARFEARLTPMSRRTHTEAADADAVRLSTLKPRTYLHFSGQPFFDEHSRGLPAREIDVHDLPVGHLGIYTHAEAVAGFLMENA